MSKCIRILYVDDNPHDRELVRDALEKEHGGFIVQEAASRKDFEKYLAEGEYDLVLSDFNILGFEGLQVLEAVHEKFPALPVVIVTGTGSEEVAVEAMKRGAADYVLKSPKHIIRLPVTIGAALERKHAGEERDRLFNFSIDLFCVAGFDGYFKQINPPWETTLGWTAKELLSKPYIEFVHPGDREATIHATQTLVDGVIVHHFENRYQCKDGSYKWLSWNSYPLPSDKRIFCVARDITDLRRAHDIIRDSERHYQRLTEILPVGIFRADSSGNTTYVNPRWSEISGLNGSNALGSGWLAVVHPDDLQSVTSGWCDAVQKGVISKKEYRFLRPDGSIAWVFGQAIPEYSSEGQFIGYVGAITDITDRKQAESDLRRIEWMLSKKPASTMENRAEAHEQGYGDLTELNRNGVIAQSVGRAILESIANDCLDLLGTSSAVYEINGCYAFGIFASGWCRMLDRASRNLCDTADNAQALSSGKWLCHESCWTRCSKEAIAQQAPVAIECNGGIHLYAAPIFAHDEVVGSINFGYGDPPKDPEKLRALAEAYHLNCDDLLREANAYDSRPPYIIEMAKSRLLASAQLIGSMVETKRAEQERVRLEEQLRQAQKIEAVGRLAGGVAHDFNNILQSILGYSQMLVDTLPQQDETHEFAAEILREGGRAAALTRQLLAFARKQTIAPEELDLNEAVAGMLKMLGRLIGEDIDLLWRPGHNLWMVKMDPTQIDQILANLVVNSRDAIAGVGKVTIETENVEIAEADCAGHPGAMPGHYVMLAVSDDGCGMDKNAQAHIFEPFFTTKEQGKGTGLGLATVYGIVKQNSGFINVYSEPGQGAVFKIYIPRHETGALEETPARECHESPRGTETVLLVEDEVTLLNLGKLLLEQLGYTVLAADTPQKAILLAEEYPGAIHILLTDVIMPGMNGRDLYQRLKDLRPEIKCIYMSGYTADVIAHHGVLEDGIHFLQKPFFSKALAEILRRALSQS